jgi:GT2 family glycosyltransferase/tRNA A-37 threonylcarbamoyl transferase component Bud32
MHEENHSGRHYQKTGGSVVSIIIVTIGYDKLLRECIDSIHKHVKCDFEVILVNNDVKPLTNLHSRKPIIIENGRNLGFARAVNKGIIAAGGDMILLLNSDTRLIDDCLTPMVSFLSSRMDAGLCGVQLIFQDNKLQNSVDMIPNVFTQILNKSILKIVFPKTYPSKRSGFKKPVEVPSIIGACMMIKRDAIDSIGMLDEGFFFYLEETDFCKRAKDHGFGVWHLPGIKVVHHQGKTAKKLDIRRKIEFQRSMFRFFIKHKDLSQTIIFYICMIIKSAVKSLINLPFILGPKSRDKFFKSGAVFLWYILGSPKGWGLEYKIPEYIKTKKNHYKWFLTEKSDIPQQAIHPGAFMNSFSDKVLNRSRTALMKSGTLDGKTIYLKRYNFKGIKDAIKNLFRKSRAQKAFEAALMLECLGLGTPGVLFACERRVFGFLLDSYIATQGIHAIDLVKYVQENFYDHKDIIMLAKYIRRIHEMGIMHTDLKGENILINKKDIFLIDMDRLRRLRFISHRRIAKNLSYLNASFIKTVPLKLRMLFLNEYIKGNPHLEKRRGSLINRISIYTDNRLKTRYN